MYCVATPISLFCFSKTAGVAQLERLRDVDFSYSVEGGAKLYSRDRNASSDMLARPKGTCVDNVWNRIIIDKSTYYLSSERLQMIKMGFISRINTASIIKVK